MKFKSPSIINFDECVFLNTEIINSISVREIQVDHTGNMAWAIVCYPNAGAGFVVCKCNEKEDAVAKFQVLLNLLMEQEGVTLITNDFVQPEPKEPEKLEFCFPAKGEEIEQTTEAPEKKGE